MNGRERTGWEIRKKRSKTEYKQEKRKDGIRARKTKGLRLIGRDVMWWCVWLGITKETAWVHQRTDPARNALFKWLRMVVHKIRLKLTGACCRAAGTVFLLQLPPEYKIMSTSCQSFPPIQLRKTPDRAGTLAFGLCGPKPIMAHHQETPCKSWLIIPQTFMTCSACTREYMTDLTPQSTYNWYKYTC